MKSKSEQAVIPLPSLGLIQVSGDNAATFLQGQLTCDVRLVNATTMQQGAFCNLKGRVLALVDVLYSWESYWLVLPKNMIEATIGSLEKTALLSRVQLKPTDNLEVLGFVYDNDHEPLPAIALPSTDKTVSTINSACCYRLNEHAYILLATPAFAKNLIEPFQNASLLQQERDWHLRQLSQHQVSIYPETRGLFLPHRLNLHNTGYISFAKGCYKGQEIIARTQYRATLKHELIHCTIESQTPPQLGAKLLDPKTGIELGELVDFCETKIPNQYVLVGSVLIEHGDRFQLENQTEIFLFHD